MCERLNVLKCINAEFFGEFRTVFKQFIHHLTILFSCIAGVFIIAYVQLPFAHAAGTTALPGAAPEVTISLPGGGQLVGHPGTKVHIAGTGFTPSSTAALYTTPTNDPAKCKSGADPAGLGLTSFATKPTVAIQADGTFQVDTTWPNSAATATTAYYVCATDAAAASGSLGAFSATSFTVAQPVTLQVTPQSPTAISPGSQVTISGTNWLPPQSLTVAITPPGAAGVVVSDHATSDAAGNFSIMLTIPATTAAGTYSVSVIADGEPTMKATLANAVTVSAAATPTPTATAAPSPTATTAPTATATTPAPTPPATGNGGGGGGGMTILIFALGGIGAVLIIVGIVLFAAYSRAT